MSDMKLPTHPHIFLGLATVPWAERIDRTRAGWVKVGGERMSNYDDAYNYAVKLNNYMLRLEK